MNDCPGRDLGAFLADCGFTVGSASRPSAVALSALPTLAQGQTDDLKVDTGRRRLWLSRDDPRPVVAVEELVDGRWITTDVYPGLPLR